MVRRGKARPLKASLLERLWGPGGGRLLGGDLAVVLLLSAVSLSLLLVPGRSGDDAAAVEVQVSGVQVMTVNRGDDGTRQVEGPLGVTVIETRDGRVRVLSSPCPLKLCRRAGWIDAAGEMIVCLPNEVVVRLGARRSDVDALSR